MKSCVLLILGLFVLVHGAPFIEETLLFEPQADVEPLPLVPIPELCTQLGLNMAVQVMKEFNLYSLLESSPPGEYLSTLLSAPYESMGRCFTELMCLRQ